MNFLGGELPKLMRWAARVRPAATSAVANNMAATTDQDGPPPPSRAPTTLCNSSRTAALSHDCSGTSVCAHHHRAKQRVSPPHRSLVYVCVSVCLYMSMHNMPVPVPVCACVCACGHGTYLDGGDAAEEAVELAVDCGQVRRVRPTRAAGRRCRRARTHFPIHLVTQLVDGRPRSVQKPSSHTLAHTQRQTDRQTHTHIQAYWSRLRRLLVASVT
jgi:hypothetical protein